MRKYLKYILMGILAVTLSSIFFKKKTEAETSLPRDYAEIAASGILRAVTEYNSISFYADATPFPVSTTNCSMLLHTAKD